ncbi:desulfoferrodoxin (superoxide reductase-like protein) [Bradyrhizobium sp. LB1.3]
MTDKEPDVPEQIVPTPSISREEAKVLHKAPLATLRATPASLKARVLASELAARYPRSMAAKGKAYARNKTKEDYANAMAAFVADLLDVIERDFSEGWLRCSLKKETYTGKAVSWHMFNGVRQALTEAGLVEHQPGYPGAYGFGNPGPSHGKLSRFRATPSLLSLCEAHGITPATVWQHFNSEEVMPSELVRLTKPSRKTPDIVAVERLRKQVAELNAFVGQHSITHPTTEIKHLGWVRIFHHAGHPDFRWNKGGRLYSYPQNTACYQHLSGAARREMRIDGEAVVEIDISSAYLSIFYAWCDQKLDTNTDAYAGILGDTVLDREVAKCWINMSFGGGQLRTKWTTEIKENVRDRLERKGIRPDAFDAKAYPMSRVCERVLQRHPILQRWGGEIRGRVRDWSDLMFVESKIIIGTMQELMAQGVPSLPVHDSLIVQSRHEAVAVDTLKEQFQTHTGATPKLGITRPEGWDF